MLNQEIHKILNRYINKDSVESKSLVSEKGFQRLLKDIEHNKQLGKDFRSHPLKYFAQYEIEIDELHLDELSAAGKSSVHHKVVSHNGPVEHLRNTADQVGSEQNNEHTEQQKSVTSKHNETSSPGNNQATESEKSSEWSQAVKYIKSHPGIDEAISGGIAATGILIAYLSYKYGGSSKESQEFNKVFEQIKANKNFNEILEKDGGEKLLNDGISAAVKDPSILIGQKNIDLDKLSVSDLYEIKSQFSNISSKLSNDVDKYSESLHKIGQEFNLCQNELMNKIKSNPESIVDAAKIPVSDKISLLETSDILPSKELGILYEIGGKNLADKTLVDERINLISQDNPLSLVKAENISNTEKLDVLFDINKTLHDSSSVDSAIKMILQKDPNAIIDVNEKYLSGSDKIDELANLAVGNSNLSDSIKKAEMNIIGQDPDSIVGSDNLGVYEKIGLLNDVEITSSKKLDVLYQINEETSDMTPAQKDAVNADINHILKKSPESILEAEDIPNADKLELVFSIANDSPIINKILENDPNSIINADISVSDKLNLLEKTGFTITEKIEILGGIYDANEASDAQENVFETILDLAQKDPNSLANAENVVFSDKMDILCKMRDWEGLTDEESDAVYKAINKLFQAEPEKFININGEDISNTEKFNVLHDLMHFTNGDQSENALVKEYSKKFIIDNPDSVIDSQEVSSGEKLSLLASARNNTKTLTSQETISLNDAINEIIKKDPDSLIDVQNMPVSEKISLLEGSGVSPSQEFSVLYQLGKESPTDISSVNKVMVELAISNPDDLVAENNIPASKKLDILCEAKNGLTVNEQNSELIKKLITVRSELISEHPDCIVNASITLDLKLSFIDKGVFDSSEKIDILYQLTQNEKNLIESNNTKIDTAYSKIFNSDPDSFLNNKTIPTSDKISIVDDLGVKRLLDLNKSDVSNAVIEMAIKQDPSILVDVTGISTQEKISTLLQQEGISPAKQIEILYDIGQNSNNTGIVDSVIKSIAQNHPESLVDSKIPNSLKQDLGMTTTGTNDPETSGDGQDQGSDSGGEPAAEPMKPSWDDPKAEYDEADIKNIFSNPEANKDAIANILTNFSKEEDGEATLTLPEGDRVLIQDLIEKDPNLNEAVLDGDATPEEYASIFTDLKNGNTESATTITNRIIQENKAQKQGQEPQGGDNGGDNNPEMDPNLPDNDPDGE